MKFRAILNDPTATRETKPEQALSNNLSELEEWAIQTIARKADHPGCEVVIFVTRETPCRVIQPRQALAIINERIQADVAAKAAAARSLRLGMPPEKPPIS